MHHMLYFVFYIIFSKSTVGISETPVNILCLDLYCVIIWTLKTILYQDFISIKEIEFKIKFNSQYVNPTSDCNAKCIHDSMTTIKPAHVVTSIKQLPALKGYFFLSCHRIVHINWTSFKRSPVLEDHFSLSQMWPLNTDLTVLSKQSTCIP